MGKWTVGLPLLLLAAACGGGGGGGSGSGGSGAALAITTQSLGDGNVGYSLFQRLAAAGGTAPYTWWISSAGDPLPPGLGLTTDGSLAGIPTAAATRSVVVVAQDRNSALAVVTLRIEVRDVEIASSASSPMLPGTSATFSASGGIAQYAFSLSQNQSGGSISGAGSYQAGGDGGVDVVRATDRDGFYDERAVTVGDDPFAGFAPRWGTSDVWWVDWDVVYDPAPTYASDLDEVLVALGLRDPASTGAVGTEADELARLLVIRRALGHVSTYYGNGIDGNAQAGGLAVSFVGPEGTAGTTPGTGGTLPAGSSRYSTICVRHGPSSSVVGTAWLDPGNLRVEHDCGDPGGTVLGVFANRILPSYLAAFDNAIDADPVGSADVSALRSLLLGNSPSGPREQAIFAVADNFGRVMGAVLAHEIGHSVGLNHSSPSEGPGDIMNTSLTVTRTVAYAFNPTHWAQLQSTLPGPNR